MENMLIHCFYDSYVRQIEVDQTDHDSPIDVHCEEEIVLHYLIPVAFMFTSTDSTKLFEHPFSEVGHDKDATTYD